VFIVTWLYWEKSQEEDIIDNVERCSNPYLSLSLYTDEVVFVCKPEGLGTTLFREQTDADRSL